MVSIASFSWRLLALATGKLETATGVNLGGVRGKEATHAAKASQQQQAANRQRHKAAGPAQVGPLGRAASTARPPVSRAHRLGQGSCVKVPWPELLPAEGWGLGAVRCTCSATGYFQFSQLPPSSKQQQPFWAIQRPAPIQSAAAAPTQQRPALLD